MQIKTFLLSFLTLLPLGASAQGRRFLHYDCLEAQPTHEAVGGASRRYQLAQLKTDWDSTRVYPVAVVLVSFSNKDFSCEDPQDFYNRIFNEEGYNEGRGPGCVADYFRQQSSGLFKPHFDIYGPVKLTKGNTTYGNYGADAFREALLLAADSLGVDFSPYVWDRAGRAEAIVFIYAGYGGNESSDATKGCIWPNTNTMSSVTVNGITMRDCSASAELWTNNRSCGIGTICHEYSHTLGLPDLYPTRGDEYSIVDEWDLMDGGNFVNNGWCPPNYSAHEKMLLGWLKPEELDMPATIEGLKPLAEGGKAYIIRTDNTNEFFLLENRQWNGWDLRTPGHGLLISHVDYNASIWSANNVNNNPNHHRYELVHADNLDYNDWEDIIGDGSTHTGGHSLYLSGTAYPFVDDSTENRSFTDTSIPAATTYSGTGLLSKPINDITENDDATVSFLFMNEEMSGIVELSAQQPERTHAAYDLTGRRVSASYHGLVIRNGKKFFSR